MASRRSVGGIRERLRVRIEKGDALSKTFGEWLAAAGWPGSAVLVANLPYNAATPILLAAVEEPQTISRAIATVQREVAQRFCARPGEDAYGYLSVRAAASCRARILFDLSPGPSRPRPKVVSSVLELSPITGGRGPRFRQKRALDLASLAFRWRRKTLANALSQAGSRTEWEERASARGAISAKIREDRSPPAKRLSSRII